MSYTFTRESAAERLQISTRTLDRHVKAGKIRSKKQGKVLYLHEDDIRDLSTPL